MTTNTSTTTGDDGLLATGTPAPGFTAADQDGNTRGLEDYDGKNLVLYFYPKDDTSGCTKEACAFNDNLDRFNQLNAEVVGVSRDGIESHTAFIRKYDLGFTLLADTDGAITRAFKAEKEDGGVRRVTYLIGPSSRIMRTYADVKVEEHAEEILKDLETMQTGQSTSTARAT